MIRVSIVGVGNCASALLQGKYFYQSKQNLKGLINEFIGGYSIKEIQFVTAFDVDRRKVGKDLSEAIFSEPNNAVEFCPVPYLNVPVLKGQVYDGVADHMSNTFIVDSEQKPVDVKAELIKSKTDILVNFLPVGSKHATEFYASEAIKAKVAFINAIPEFICSNKSWEEKFIEAGLPCAGDDIKSQVGATIINRMLTQLIYERGCIIDDMFQLNIGGNSDFENMKEETRLHSKRISKTQSVLSTIREDQIKPNVKIGPSEYIPHLRDKKICYINIKGAQFGQLPFELDLKLSVEDSPNCAGIMIDVIRLIKIAKDNNLKGNVLEINAFAFKSPSIQMPDYQAKSKIEEFIRKYTVVPKK